VAFLEIKQVVVAAFDLNGKPLWLVRSGAFQNDHGFSSSPILYDDKVILSAQGKQGNFLVALSRVDGHTIWKDTLDNPSNSFGQPLARVMAGRPQLILCGDKAVTSFDPMNGQRLWFVQNASTDFVITPVFSEQAGLLLSSSSWPKRELQAIQPDGQGDVTKTKIVWRSVAGAPYVPSPIAVDRFLLTVAEAGNEIYCFEAATGQILWHEPFGHAHASPVSAGGLVYFLNDKGVTHVVKAGEKFELASRSASPRTAGS
jgi:outer membrane protein assembly factor BamB